MGGQRAGSASPTRLAPYDFVIDTTLYAATLAYLTLAGFLPTGPVLAFGALALAGWLAFRHKVIGVLFVRVVDLAAVVVVFEHEPKIGGLLILWLVVLAIGYRRRLMERLPRGSTSWRACWVVADGREEIPSPFQ